jgi:hypothetical protein
LHKRTFTPMVNETNDARRVARRSPSALPFYTNHIRVGTIKLSLPR